MATPANGLEETTANKLTERIETKPIRVIGGAGREGKPLGTKPLRESTTFTIWLYQWECGAQVEIAIPKEKPTGELVPILII